MSHWVQLSRAQKWDLIRMAAAAVLSIVFLTLPLMLPHQAAAPAAAAPAAELVPRVAVIVRDQAAPVEAPKLGPARFPHRAASTRRQPSGVSAAAKPIPHRSRFARFVAGDGRYSVRPFPTVGN